jgi:hypothetical protein
MASPFDRVTESDRMRVFEDTQSFEAELAAKNSAIFDAELKRMSIDDINTRKSKENERDQVLAEYGQSVISSTNDPAERIRRTQQFLSNPRNAKFSKDIMANSAAAANMFTAANQEAMQSLSLKSAKRADDFNTKHNDMLEKIAAQELTNRDLEAAQKEFTFKQTDFENEEKAMSAFRSITSGIPLENMPETTRGIVSSQISAADEKIRGAATETERLKAIREYASAFGPLAQTSQTFTVLKSNLATRHNATIARLQETQKDAYASWRIQNKAKPKDQRQPDNFETFLTSSISSESDNPIKQEVAKNKDSQKAIESLIHLSDIKSEMGSYLTAVGTTGINQPALLQRQADRLTNKMNLIIGSFKSETEIEKAELDRMRVQSTVDKNQATADNAKIALLNKQYQTRLNTIQKEKSTNIRRRNEITNMLQESEPKKQPKNPDELKEELKTLGKQYEALDNEENNLVLPSVTSPESSGAIPEIK